MNYLHFAVGHVSAGTGVTVKLTGCESDVFLVDHSNYSRFRSGQDFKYVGGHYNQSPVHLRVPTSGDWTAIVIPTGGTVNASVDVHRSVA